MKLMADKIRGEVWREVWGVEREVLDEIGREVRRKVKHNIFCPIHDEIVNIYSTVIDF